MLMRCPNNSTWVLKKWKTRYKLARMKKIVRMMVMIPNYCEKIPKKIGIQQLTNLISNERFVLRINQSTKSELFKNEFNIILNLKIVSGSIADVFSTTLTSCEIRIERNQKYNIPSFIHNEPTFPKTKQLPRGQQK